MKILSSTLSVTVLTSLVLTTLTPVTAQQTNSNSRDNSGRQLAMVTPLPPTTVVPRPVPLPVTSFARVPASSQPKGSDLSPAMNEMLKKGAVIAQNVSATAVKRAGDVAIWVTTMWKELNDSNPGMTPVRDLSGPMPPMSAMRPISPSHHHKMYFTNERRMKTVIGR